MPDVVGLSAADARRDAEGGGPEGGGALLADRRADRGRHGAWTSRPTVGEEVDEGATVVIIVGAFEEDRHARARGDAHSVRVAVLGGGRSSEHQVSLVSAESVRAGLAEAGHTPVEVLLERDGRWTSDGRAAGARARRRAARRRRGVPGRCTGRSARTARCRGCWSCSTCPTWGRAWRRRRVAMDKSLFKDLLAAHGVPQVEYAVARDGSPLDLAGLTPPLFVKPARLGSSVGISKVWSEEELDAALRARLRARPDRPGGASRGRHGGGVLGARPLRPGRLAAGGDRAAARRGLVRLRGQVRERRDGADRARPPAGGDARDGAPAGRGGLPDRRLLGDGARGLLRGGRPGARERAQHDPRVHLDERLRQAARGRRDPVLGAAGPARGAGARAPRTSSGRYRY